MASDETGFSTLREPPEGVILPAASLTLRVETPDSLGLRVAVWRDEQPDQPAAGTIVLLQGRSEFIEKYAESIVALRQRGFAVVAFDWRGQGGSQRLLANPRKGHVEDFADYLIDLDSVLAQARSLALPEPFHALAHSMGGAITLMALERGVTPFSRVVLSSPLVRIGGLRFESLARGLAQMLVSFGFAGAFIPGGRARSIVEMPFEDNPLTRDSARYERAQAWARIAPDLMIGDPTIGWVDAAMHALARFDAPEFGCSNTTPVLMLLAGGDTVVSSPAAEALAYRMRAASAVVLPGARHELLIETMETRALFWAAFDAFVPGLPEAQPDAAG